MASATSLRLKDGTADQHAKVDASGNQYIFGIDIALSALLDGLRGVDNITLTDLDSNLTDLDSKLTTLNTLVDGVEPLLTAIRDGQSAIRRKLLDYDDRSDGNPVYVGTNSQTALITDTDWAIQKLFYDSSDRLTDAQVLMGAWINRIQLDWRTAGGD